MRDYGFITKSTMKNEIDAEKAQKATRFLSQNSSLCHKKVKL